MTTWTHEHGRMLRAARALKAYFERKWQLSLELLSEAPAEAGEGDVRFSLTMSQHGLWGLRAPKALEQEQQSDIYNTFHTVLGGVDVLEEQRQDAIRLEAKLNELIGELPTNVIPMRRIGPAPAPRRSADRHWMLKQDCLIESPHVSEVHKMAMELHAHSRRYAFVDIRDVNPQSRTRVDELISLGSVTLFVPDILQLTSDEQAALLQLTNTDSQSRPLVMAGTALPFSELRCVAGFHLELLNLLSRAYIKLTRPFSEYREQGLIHYFLDSLSENPS